MIRELLSLATTARIELGKAMAGPCPHCEARNKKAIEAAAVEAMAARQDYDQGVREVAGLGVAQLEAFLIGVGEARR